MSDMYGAVRSNVFRVRNPEAFEIWFEKYRFGQEIELWREGDCFSFGGYEQYPNAYPQTLVSAEQTVDRFGDPYVDEEWEDADLDQFTTELREHLAEGEVFHVVAAGHEKLRYVACTALTIHQSEGEPRWTMISSDDPTPWKV